MDELQKAVREEKEKWMGTKMRELNVKSPTDIILDERRRLGNSDQKIVHEINVSPLNDLYRQNEIVHQTRL
jgi:hypothetical protein